jgi:hypothetical protein
MTLSSTQALLTESMQEKPLLETRRRSRARLETPLERIENMGLALGGANTSEQSATIGEAASQTVYTCEYILRSCGSASDA